MKVNSGKATTNDVQIGDVKGVGKRPMVFGKSVNPTVQGPTMANDHEANNNSSTDKYHQPRWCPPRLTHMQKRKLQRLRDKENKE